MSEFKMKKEEATLPSEVVKCVFSSLFILFLDWGTMTNDRYVENRSDAP